MARVHLRRFPLALSSSKAWYKHRVQDHSLEICATVPGVLSRHGLQHPEGPRRDASAGVLARIRFGLLLRSRHVGVGEHLLGMGHESTLPLRARVATLVGGSTQLDGHLCRLAWFGTALLLLLLTSLVKNGRRYGPVVASHLLKHLEGARGDVASAVARVDGRVVQLLRVVAVLADVRGWFLL